MPEFRLPQSLRAQFMSFIGMVFLGMAVLMISSILFFVYSAEQTAWRARQSEAAENASQRVGDYLRQNEKVLAWLDKYGYDEIKKNPSFLSEYLTDNLAFLEIVIVDERGNMLYSAARNQPTLANQFTILQSEWFRVANSGQETYSRVQVSAENASYVIFAMPSHEGGVIAAQIQMDPLWEKVAQIRFGKKGGIYVVSHSGQVIAHPDREIVLSNQNIGSTAMFQSILQSPEYKWTGGLINFEGLKVVTVSMPIENTDWIVISELPEAEAYASSRRAAVFIPILILVLITIVTLSIRKIMMVLILKPIDLLRQGANQIGLGNLTFRIEIPRKDEFGEVMAVFNEMAVDLEKNQENLQKAIAYEYESKRARELDILLKASEATSSSLDFDMVMQTLASQLLEISGFESCFISEWDKDTDTVVGRLDYSKTFWREEKRDTFSMNDYPRSKDVLLTGVPIILQGDFEAEEKKWMNELKRTGVIILALQKNNKSIGLVEIATTKKEHLFDQRVLPVCQEILAKAAPSLVEPLSANDPAKLFTIEEALVKASGAEVCSFSEWDESENRVINLAAYSNMAWASGKGTRFNPDLESWRLALDHGEVLAISRLEENSAKAVVFDGTETMEVESLIVFPLQKGKERIGVIELYDFNNKRQVTPEQITLLRTIADKASYSIENAKLFEQTQKLSLTDQLTELFNMRYFLNFARLEFERIRRYERTISVAMVDVDFFKKINDTYGHDMGDQILREVAARIKKAVRTVDIVARYGGEEFVFLMPETGSSEANQVAERVRLIVANSPIEIKDYEIPVTVSLGVAEVDERTKSLDELLKHADQVLYIAKTNGRNRVESYSSTGGLRS